MLIIAELIRNHVGKLLLLGLFILYIIFQTNDVYGGDVGDFVTTSYIGGIPHPPGYPFFTLLGFLLSKVLFFIQPLRAIGLISVVSSVISVYILFRLCKEISKNSLISYISSSILAFSYLFWLYAEIPEVFALNNALSLTVIFFVYRLYKTGRIRNLYLLSFFMALGITNHHTIILLLPGIIVILGRKAKIMLKTRQIIKSLLFFLLGLTPYLYIPAAAMFNPIINWNGQPTLSNLFSLFTRQIYGSFQASPVSSTTIDEKWVIFLTFIERSIQNVTIPVVLIILFGIFYVLKKDRILALFLIVSFLISGPFFNVYSAFPLVSVFNLGVAERFYIMPSLILLIFVPYGLMAIYIFMTHFFNNKMFPKIIIASFILIPCFLFIKNNSKVNLSKLNIGNMYAYNVLSPLPQNSLVLLSGDTAIFNVWYLYYVKKFRPDVEIVWTSGLTGSQYVVNEKKVFDSSKELKNKYRNSFWKYLLSKKSVFSVTPITTGDDDLKWVPKGVNYHLIFSKDKENFNDYYYQNMKNWSKLKLPNFENLQPYEKNETPNSILNEYSKMLTNTGVYIYSEYNNSTASAYFLDLAIKADSSYAQAYAAKAIVLSNLKNEYCIQSSELLRKAFILEPTNLNFYAFIKLIENECADKIISSDFDKYFKDKYKISPKSLLNDIKNAKKN